MGDPLKKSNCKFESAVDDTCATDKKDEKLITVNLGFIGAGNMATAIREGLLKSGIIKASQIYVSAPSHTNLIHWKSRGVNTTTENSEIILKCPIVILAVKPQYAADAVMAAYKKFDRCILDSVTLVSVLAGISCEDIKEMVTNALTNKTLAYKINISRAMPNTPLMVGEGCTVVCFKTNDSENPKVQSDFTEHKKFIKNIFSVSGYCEEVGEHLINPVGALSGSGPAYVYQIIEALSDGAVKLGVPRNSSYILAAQTLIGAAKMVISTGKHPGQLKDEVCSPGGTTIAGITAMEKNGVRYGLIQAIEAAYQRSEEIASKLSRPK